MVTTPGTPPAVSSTKIVTEASWIGGMSSDEYLGPENSYWDGWNIDTRKNSREMSIWGYRNDTYMECSGPSTCNWSQIGLTGFANTGAILSGGIMSDGSGYGVIDGVSIKNIYKMKTTAGIPYNFAYFGNKLLVLSNNKIHQINYAFNPATGYGIRDTEAASTLSTWTGGAGWSYNAGTSQWEHSSGTNTLTDGSGTISNTTYYRVSITGTCTAGTATVTMGGKTFGTLSSTTLGVTSTAYVMYETTSSTAQIVITPSNDFNGKIGPISIRPITTGFVESQWTMPNTSFYTPRCINNLGLYIGNLNMVHKLERNGSAYLPTSGALTTVLTLNSGEEIINIFKLGDQFVLFTKTGQYYWDGVNQYVDRYVKWEDEIYSVAQYKNDFYVITNSGRTCILWKTSDGYDRIQLFKEDSIYKINPRLTQSIIFNGAAATTQGIVFFASGGSTAPGYIYSYGAYNPGMPQSFSKIKSPYFISNVFKGSLDNLYYATSIGSKYYVGEFRDYVCDDFSTTRMQYTLFSQGVTMMSPIIGISQSTNKKTEKLKFGYNSDALNYDGKTQSPGVIAIYSRIDDEVDKFTFIHYGSITTIPTAGATYTNNGRTFTVVSATKIGTGSTAVAYIYCTSTPTPYVIPNPLATGTLTKSTGTGDSTITYDEYIPFRLVQTIDLITAPYGGNKRFSIMYSIGFNKIQFATGIVSRNSATTPSIFDFNCVYNELQNDL